MTAKQNLAPAEREAAHPAHRLAATLATIAAIDPSRHGHTGPDTPEVTAQYARRNRLIWLALALAHDAGIPAGVRHDPTDPRPIVVDIDLPTGQISWHLPAHPNEWDGHTTAEKYQRLEAFVRAQESAATGCSALCRDVEDDRDRLAAELEQVRADLADTRATLTATSRALAGHVWQAAADRTRVVVVVDWTPQRVHGITHDDAIAQRWTREIVAKHGDPLAATMTAGLVDTAPAPGSATRAQEVLDAAEIGIESPDCIQVVMHPAHQTAYRAWLVSQDLHLCRITGIKDDLPTYAIGLGAPEHAQKPAEPDRDLAYWQRINPIRDRLAPAIRGQCCGVGNCTCTSGVGGGDR